MEFVDLEVTRNPKEKRKLRRYSFPSRNIVKLM